MFGLVVGINGNTMPATNLSSSPLSVPKQVSFFFYDFELKSTKGSIPGDFMGENPQQSAHTSWGPGYAMSNHHLSACPMKNGVAIIYANDCGFCNC